MGVWIGVAITASLIFVFTGTFSNQGQTENAEISAEDWQ